MKVSSSCFSLLRRRRGIRKIMLQLSATSVIAIILLAGPPIAAGFTSSLHVTLKPHIFGSTSSNRRDAPTKLRSQKEDKISISMWGSSPYLAILTEPDACTSVERVEETIRAIEQATSDGGVNLVVVRVANDARDETALHKWGLLKNLAEMKCRRRFLLVVNDDVDIVLRALSQNITVDGVHVKEHNSHLIPSIRSQLEHAVTCSFDSNGKGLLDNIIIGTSCHSIQSAMKSYQLTPRGPDYLFVGTCYLTQSHPEKQSLDQLEGPSLPGRVKRELHQIYNDNVEEDGDSTNAVKTSQSTSTQPSPPIIFAIGGIDERNCHQPVATYGADGVATIRTVMQASDPRGVVRCMKSAMQDINDINNKVR